jgi:hypothetical protein
MLLARHRLTLLSNVVQLNEPLRGEPLPLN